MTRFFWTTIDSRAFRCGHPVGTSPYTECFRLAVETRNAVHPPSGTLAGRPNFSLRFGVLRSLDGRWNHHRLNRDSPGRMNTHLPCGVIAAIVGSRTSRLSALFRRTRSRRSRDSRPAADKKATLAAPSRRAGGKSVAINVSLHDFESDCGEGSDRNPERCYLRFLARSRGRGCRAGRLGARRGESGWPFSVAKGLARVRQPSRSAEPRGIAHSALPGMPPPISRPPTGSTSPTNGC